ncbi:CMRF35-like molecule 7 [Brachyhypopomus gauderio]|uniref:CMRF35-like molecule 7 n=1 Tax=Brachyhypopomus gauderio TaxID=698409 RepID=UPI0040412FA8
MAGPARIGSSPRTPPARPRASDPPPPQQGAGNGPAGEAGHLPEGQHLLPPHPRPHTPETRGSATRAPHRQPGQAHKHPRVSGEEGSSVSVQCLYSAAYQNKQKQWCRSTDWSCYTVGRTYTSQNSAVWIREGIRSFKVEMTGLKKSDAGWYWCSVGDVQVPVHLNLTDALTAITHRNTTENKEQTQENKEERITVIWSLMGVGLLLLTGLVCSICMAKRKCKVPRSAGSAETDTHTAASTSDDTVLYSSIGFKSKKSKQRSLEKPPDAHNGIIYSSVANH